jgi:hypothetical protein
MNFPVIKGIIDRRILVNFTIDADIARKIIPAPFTPKLFKGKAIAGICLIRLKDIRPKGLPAFVGISSENGAHRIAVEWMENDVLKEGVFIPRRDTSSRLNALAGGRIFPGRHVHANFNVKEAHDQYHVDFTSTDGTFIAIDGTKADTLPADSIFDDLATVSAFFEKGAAGYSPNGNCYDGLELKVKEWKVDALTVTNVRSSYFENKAVFPEGSVQFDNALLMRGIEHEWHGLGSL